MTIETIQQLVDDSFSTATEKGWHDPKDPRTVGDLIALMHSELSEALEDHRDGRSPTEGYYEVTEKHTSIDGSVTTTTTQKYKNKADIGANLMAKAKPAGIAIELADCVIRIADFCGKYGIDLAGAINAKAEYNKTRPIKHGGKKI
jgi:NTP pyrophosphatase (non-canonical NTP hydrolase)